MSRVRFGIVVAAVVPVLLAVALMFAHGFGWDMPDSWREESLFAGTTVWTFLCFFAATYPGDYPGES